MRDFTAGHIAGPVAGALMRRLDPEFDDGRVRVPPRRVVPQPDGVAGRRGGRGEAAACTPPHDILDRPVAGYLPRGEAGAALVTLMGGARCHRGPERGDRRVVVGPGPHPDHAHLPRAARPGRRRGRRRRPGQGHRPLRRHGGRRGARRHRRPRHRLRRQGAGRARGARPAPTSCSCTSKLPTRPATWATSAKRSGLSRRRRGGRGRLDRVAAATRRVLVLPDHPTPIRLRTHVGTPVPFVFGGGERARHRPERVRRAQRPPPPARRAPTGPR